MFTVYVLKSKVNGTYYVGSCEDIVIRLSQHNSRNVPSTKRYAPWSLFYTEQYDTVRQARQRERQLKFWKSRAAIERLASKI